MRAASLFVSLAILASAASANVVEAPNQARDLGPQPTPQALAERQLGGGGGVQTSINSLQTISGYTPPESTEIPEPVVSQGSIVATGAIPGFNSSASSGAMPQMSFQPVQLMFAMTGGAAAGAAYLLF